MTFKRWSRCLIASIAGSIIGICGFTIGHYWLIGAAEIEEGIVPVINASYALVAIFTGAIVGAVLGFAWSELSIPRSMKHLILAMLIFSLILVAISISGSWFMHKKSHADLQHWLLTVGLLAWSACAIAMAIIAWKHLRASPPKMPNDST